MDKIETLKKLVAQSQNLNEPLSYFFDLMEDKSFQNDTPTAVKNIENNPELMTVISIVKDQSNERLKQSIKELTPVLFTTPQYHFFHGSCLTDQLMMPIIVIYFSDIQTGIFALHNKKTEMVRFSIAKKSDLEKEKLN